MNVDAVRRQIVSAFEEAGEVVAVYLYGSYGRGDARPDSDVDLGVLLLEKPPSTLHHPSFRFQGMLEERLGLRVDVVVLNDAPADLIHRVLRDGLLLLDRDPSRRIRFEVHARNEYFDLLPILHRYRHPAGDRS